MFCMITAQAGLCLCLWFRYSVPNTPGPEIPKRLGPAIPDYRKVVSHRTPALGCRELRDICNGLCKFRIRFVLPIHEEPVIERSVLIAPRSSINPVDNVIGKQRAPRHPGGAPL